LKILLVHNEYGRPSGEEEAIATVAQLLESKGHTLGWFIRRSSEIHVSAHENGPTLRSENGPTRLMR
jgi:hypothetical protein